MNSNRDSRLDSKGITIIWITFLRSETTAEAEHKGVQVLPMSPFC